ncbi:MAG: hypothetical protein MJY78_11535 [Fibrobacter sp.]|nr:hypothetical protein [Fibrobacter sp.]
MSEEIISKEQLEERYKKIVIRTEETVNPFSGKKEKRTVVDLIHDGSIYYVHIEFSPFGTTYSGDMGCFMFQPGYGIGTFKDTRINPCYWGEKIKAAGQEYFIRDFDMQNVDRAYKEEILQHYEYEWEEEYFEEAKKAWEMSDDDFKKWYEIWHEREDEEDFAEEVERVRNAGKPSDYSDRDSEESAYDAVEAAAEQAGLHWDCESIGYISKQGEEDDYRFLYACCVLQWVANKIVNKEK